MLTAVLQEACCQGAPPLGRRAGAGLGLHGSSRHQIKSRGWGELDAKIQGFLARPLAGNWPDLRLDTTSARMRREGRSVSVSAAVHDQGRREVLGLALGTSEAETFRTACLRSLALRVRLTVSADHKGLRLCAIRSRTKPSSLPGTLAAACAPGPAAKSRPG